MFTFPTYLDLRRWWCPVVAALLAGVWIQHRGFIFDDHPVTHPVGRVLVLVAVLAVALIGTSIIPLLWYDLPDAVRHPARFLLIAYGFLTGLVIPTLSPVALPIAASPLAGIAALAMGLFVLDEPGES